ncbi:MAG: hypothetical protein ACI9WU_002727 [Myxococcota bacterium]|jgi:hypothetical protein
MEFWIDNNKNYLQIIQPGGSSFPIDIVVDREGKIRYLANAYYPGEAIGEAKNAL